VPQDVQQQRRLKEKYHSIQVVFVTQMNKEADIPSPFNLAQITFK